MLPQALRGTPVAHFLRAALFLFPTLPILRGSDDAIGRRSGGPEAAYATANSSRSPQPRELVLERFVEQLRSVKTQEGELPTALAKSVQHALRQ
jgi:hypothetical protein